MLLAVLFSLQAFALKLPGPVADRVRTETACALLLEATTEMADASLTEARALAAAFAQKHLRIALSPDSGARGTLRVLSSAGKDDDRLVSARFLSALDARADVVGGAGGALQLFDLYSKIKTMAPEYHAQDRREWRRAVRWYSMIPVGGGVVTGLGLALNQPSLVAAGALIASLPAHALYQTWKSLKPSLTEASDWLQRIALEPKKNEWVHIHAVDAAGAVLDLIAFVDDGGEARYASFISK